MCTGLSVALLGIRFKSEAGLLTALELLSQGLLSGRDHPPDHVATHGATLPRGDVPQ